MNTNDPILHLPKCSCKFKQRPLWTNNQACKENSRGHLNNEYNLCDIPKSQCLLSSQTWSLVQKGLCLNLQEDLGMW